MWFRFKLLSLMFAALLCAAPVHAQETHAMLVVSAATLRSEAQTMADRYAEGMQLRAAGDNHRAFVAFRDAAVLGHPQAQRRLGEIYDTGSDSVRRDYLKSLRWYQAAREQGEDVPTAQPRRNFVPAFH